MLALNDINVLSPAVWRVSDALVKAVVALRGGKSWAEGTIMSVSGAGVCQASPLELWAGLLFVVLPYDGLEYCPVSHQ